MRYGARVFRYLHARPPPQNGLPRRLPASDRIMLSRKQDELFSHAARLALRGSYAAKDGDKPSSLKPLLDQWAEIEGLAMLTSGPARRVAQKILLSAATRKPQVLNGKATNDSYRQFGQELVLLFKIGRGDDPMKYPLEFGDYY